MPHPPTSPLRRAARRIAASGLKAVLGLAVALTLLLLQPAASRATPAGADPASSDVAGAALAGADLPNAARSGAQLFENHCAGCHVNGGNIIRRGKTLRLAALERNGIDGPEAIATIAAAGIGQMGGYASVLGEGGPEAVAAWVWQQAQAGWPRG